MSPNLTILYRGPLSSCNYHCPYCPFAKRYDSPLQLEQDAHALGRLVNWIHERQAPTSIFFTPWGEALIHAWYQDAIVELSRFPHVVRVAIQTNLHAPLGFLAKCDTTKVGFWCSYHEGQVKLSRFLRQCRVLDHHAVDYSVGTVGVREALPAIEALRAALPSARYLWINAYKHEPDYYTAEEIAQLTRIDPLFPINKRRHASLGQACWTGHTVVSVDGVGDVRRCHLVADVIGNLYEPEFTACLQPRPCPNLDCGCHIGYVHLQRLGLYQVYGDRVLERIPAITGRS